MDPHDSYSDLETNVKTELGNLQERLLELGTKLADLSYAFSKSEPSTHDRDTPGEELTDRPTNLRSAIDQANTRYKEAVAACARVKGILKGMTQQTPVREDGQMSEFEHSTIKVFSEIGLIESHLAIIAASLRRQTYRQFRKQRRSGTQNPAVSAAQAVLNHIQNALFPHLKTLSTTFYNWIINVVKPTGWSIGGEIGVRLFFQANATIEVRFGK